MKLEGRAVLFYRVVDDGGDKSPVPLHRALKHKRSEYKRYEGTLYKPRGVTRAARLSWGVKWLPTKKNKGKDPKLPTIILRDDVEAIKYLSPRIGETVIWRSQNGDPDFYGLVQDATKAYKFKIKFPGLSKEHQIEVFSKWILEDGGAPLNMFQVVTPGWTHKRIEKENAARVSRPPRAVPARNILQRALIIKSAQDAILKDLKKGAGPLVVARNLGTAAARARIRLVKGAMERTNKGWEGETGYIGGAEDNGIVLSAFTNRRGLATIRHLIPSSMEYRRQQMWWKAYNEEMTIEVYVKTRITKTAAAWKKWKKKRQKIHEKNTSKSTLEKMLDRKFYQDIEIQQLGSVIGTRIHQFLNFKLEDGGGAEEEEEGDDDRTKRRKARNRQSAGSTPLPSWGRTPPSVPRTPRGRKRGQRRQRRLLGTGNNIDSSDSSDTSDTSDSSDTSDDDKVPPSEAGKWGSGVNSLAKSLYDTNKNVVRRFETQSVGLANEGLIITTKDWALTDNAGEGDCMFYAFSACIEASDGIKVTHFKIRKAVTDFMQLPESSVYYSKHFEYAHANMVRPPQPTREATRKAFKKYMEYVSQVGNYTTELELQALTAMPLKMLDKSLVGREPHNIMVFINNGTNKHSWVMQDGWRLPQNRPFIAIHSNAHGTHSGSHYQALIPKEGASMPSINAQFIGASAAPTGPVSTLMAKLPRRGTAEFNDFVEAVTSLTEEEKLLKLMAEATLRYLRDLKGFELVAMELPVIDMHQAFNMGSAASPKIVFLESRVDFVATLNGKLILGDFKNRIGNTTQYDNPSSDSIAQLVLYAWLMWTNFAIAVEELWLLATNRHGEVMCFKFPFAASMDKGGAYSKSGRGAVAEGNTGRRDVQEWLAAYTSNENVRIANESFYFTPTGRTGETVVPAGLDGQSELIEQLFDKEVRYDRPLGHQRINVVGVKNYMKGYTWEGVEWGGSKMWHRVKGTRGVPKKGLRREPLGLYAMFDPRLSSKKRPNARPKGKVARVDARFQLYQDTEDGRKADAGWSVYPGARRIGKQHGRGDVDRGVISVSGYEEERPGAHHTARMKLWSLVNTTALEMVAAWGLDDDDDDDNIVAFCDQLEIDQRGASLSTHVARALHSCVDRELVVHMREKGTIRNDVAFNADRSQFYQNTEFPYSADRFTDFEHMSQRVAWSTAMLAKGIKLVPSCGRDINASVDRGGRNDIFDG